MLEMGDLYERNGRDDEAIIRYRSILAATRQRLADMAQKRLNELGDGTCVGAFPRRGDACVAVESEQGAKMGKRRIDKPGYPRAPRAAEARLPDLAAFRASIKIKGKPLSEIVIACARRSAHSGSSLPQSGPFVGGQTAQAPIIPRQRNSRRGMPRPYLRFFAARLVNRRRCRPVGDEEGVAGEAGSRHGQAQVVASEGVPLRRSRT